MMTEHQRWQYGREIAWLEKEIEKLALQVVRKPRKQRQIDEYRRQIEHKKCQIAMGE